MSNWPSVKDFKNYPHFDRRMRESDILELVTSEKSVAENSFYPFIQYSIKYKPFAGKDKDGNPLPRGEPKERIIRYAARRDAYIYAYYRRVILKHYENKLAELNISECPIAYRKIPIAPDSTKGKNNIHFANDSFNEIIQRKNCFAVALDISKFFENLDHQELLKKWCYILGANVLPPDHEAVFKSITQYAFVDRDACYERLGYLKTETVDGKSIKKLSPKIPYKLCSRQDFKRLILGKGSSLENLVQKNVDRGIPQGSPISDILANLYLIEFDLAVKNYMNSIGAYYRRYSDDILFICEKNENKLYEAIKFLNAEIKRAGSHLLIKPSKTNITEFTESESKISCRTVKQKPEDPEKPFEYLGFSFDGKNKLIRNTTLSNFYRKVSKNCHAYAAELITRYPGKTLEELIKLANLPRFYQRFGKVEQFEEKCSGDPSKWTFLTYARKAAKIMKNDAILSQISKRNKVIERRLLEALSERLDKIAESSN